ncbi:MAG TPA: pyrimidine dimer DNA glycosylase/endonuclease V [Vicinamibacteria bacterium]|jgi:hypothetical protein
MRIWTLHPRLLDRRGLVALWREALLAQAVLRGRTRGYRHHPQLLRFRRQATPLGCIAAYLRAVHAEASSRGYSFARERIGRAKPAGRMVVARGQLEHEWRHLRAKVARRDPGWLEKIGPSSTPRPHPLFRVVPGGVEGWERGVTPRRRAPASGTAPRSRRRP